MTKHLFLFVVFGVTVGQVMRNTPYENAVLQKYQNTIAGKKYIINLKLLILSFVKTV